MSIYKDVALDDLSFHSKTQAFCISFHGKRAKKWLIAIVSCSKQQRPLTG
ncbi:hypothetical protein [uncultured Nitrosomonas sp.]|nr:hypothetical protein [uncultured Nitrosomonas sp.]